MSVADVFNKDKQKMTANPQGEQSSPIHNNQSSNSDGGSEVGVGNVNLQGRSRLNPNGDVNALQSGGVNSDGSYTTGGVKPSASNAGAQIGTENDAIATARMRRDQAAVNNPFRENGYYTKIFKETTPFRPPTVDELRRSQRRERSQKIVAAIGDGISSLANLYFTTQYAPNAYNPQASLSAASAKRWEQLRKDRLANTEKYIQGLMNAEARDDANTADRRNYEWNIYNTQAREAEADRDYAYRLEQAEREREAAAAAAAEDARRWEAEQERKDREAQERSRHNRTMEGIARRKAARSGGGGSRGRGGSRSGGITLRANDGTSLNLPTQLWNDDNFINEFWERNIKGYNDWNGRGVQEIISATDKEPTNNGTRVPYTDNSGKNYKLAEKRRQTLGRLLNGDSGYDDVDVLTILGMFDDLDDIYN